MRELRRGARKHPRAVLNQPSPYGSSQLVVESDAAVTAAYLLDGQGRVRSALWLANHVPAPARLDQERIQAGLLPPMPAGYTKHPGGRNRPRRRSLEAVWFEEGDGAAIMENGSPLGVVPGWSDTRRGLPGYSRDAVGRTPLAWALDDVYAVLGPRIGRARDFWQWQSGAAGWQHYQQAVLEYLEEQLGRSGRYWSVDGGRLPRMGLAEHPPTTERPYTVYSTVGMGYQPMPPAEGRDPSAGRVELAVAAGRPHESVVDLFRWLSPYPWRHRRRLGPGHEVAWDSHAGRFPLGGPWEGVCLLADPGILLGPAVPDLPARTLDGAAVQWIWLAPITGRDHALAETYGTHVLVDDLIQQGREWVIRL